MRLSRTLACLALLAAASSTPNAVVAQNGGAATVSAERLAMARELLDLLQMETIMKGSSEMMIEAQLSGNPMLTPYRDVLTTWAQKYLTWQVMGDRIASVYAETFTEGELRDLVIFYRTPTGQKLARATPGLMQKGAEVGEAVAREHQAELVALVQERSKELAAQGVSPTPPKR